MKYTDRELAALQLEEAREKRRRADEFSRHWKEAEDRGKAADLTEPSDDQQSGNDQAQMPDDLRENTYTLGANEDLPAAPYRHVRLSP